MPQALVWQAVMPNLCTFMSPDRRHLRQLKMRLYTKIIIVCCSISESAVHWHESCACRLVSHALLSASLLLAVCCRPAGWHCGLLQGQMCCKLWPLFSSAASSMDLLSLPALGTVHIPAQQEEHSPGPFP